ncbi:MAG: NifU family protein [Firmicutes bacterium]|nr:NifU family protein [Bacillota bacterium]
MAIDVKVINEALDQIRPILARDGGGIEFVDVTDEDIVQVRLQGHCAGCPGARMTLSNIVEQILAQACPEIKGVQAVD